MKASSVFRVELRKRALWKRAIHWIVTIASGSVGMYTGPVWTYDGVIYRIGDSTPLGIVSPSGDSHDVVAVVQRDLKILDATTFEEKWLPTYQG